MYPLAEFARRVGGERVTVTTLVPAGVDAHDYEPTPRDLAALTRVRLLIYNGAGFEPWVAKLLTQVPDGTVKVKATEGLPLSTANGGTDPHVWLDPVLAQEQVARILEGLVRVDPDGRAAYEANAAGLRADLEALHRAFASGLARCRRREFITSHAAFGYLARRYGLVMIPISGLAPQAEPSAARLAAVARLARQRGIRVIYADPLADRRGAETVAREVGAVVEVLHPLEGLTPEEQRQGKKYITVMHENLRHLAQGLECR
jgi:zinc transport system substrate-binding protein